MPSHKESQEFSQEHYMINLDSKKYFMYKMYAGTLHRPNSKYGVLLKKNLLFSTLKYVGDFEIVINQKGELSLIP